MEHEYRVGFDQSQCHTSCIFRDDTVIFNRRKGGDEKESLSRNLMSRDKEQGEWTGGIFIFLRKP